MRTDLTYTGAVWSGPRAFDEAGVSHGDIDYVSIYDSFTITVLITLEDLGFCAKGEGGRFVSDGTLLSTGHCRSTPTAVRCATTTRPTAGE